MQYKLKHRLSAALMAGAMCCTMIPAASADEIATPETADTAVPEVTDSAAPDISQITENLYNDLPDAPTGSYLGSMGLPVATGETKISISAWVSDLYDGADAHIDADALNEDETTITIGKNLDANYAIIPLLVQTEYPANGATAEVVLPEGVEVLSYASTDADLIPAGDAEQSKILYQTYVEQSAAATGFYVKAFSDFTAQFVYASPDGTTLQKSIHVHDSHVMASLCFVIDGNIFLAVLPPVVFRVVVGRFYLQQRNFPIWQTYKVVHICQHERILRVLEHLFDLEYFQPGFLGEYLRDQRFQQMPHFQRHPVACIIDSRSNVQLVIVQVAGGAERRNAEDCGDIAAAYPLPAVCQPFLLVEVFGADQHLGFLPYVVRHPQPLLSRWR